MGIIMVICRENREHQIDTRQAADAVKEFFAAHRCAGKRILLIVPDNTRSGPVGKIFQMIYDNIGASVANLDILVALGTHQPLTESQICDRLEITIQQRRSQYNSVRFFNHQWEKHETFVSLGTISADEINRISQGLFQEKVNVAVNRLLLDYDEFFILGPVFPHEVVGFSGGHKYIFPGIAGPEIINFFHWLGAVITNPAINGTKWTPTRRVVEKAASMIPIPHQLFAFVALRDQLKGLYIGPVLPAWEKASDLSARVHIVYKEKPYHTVLGLAPEMYDDIWTAGKVMYKLEPIVADGGTLIIYAPHIKEISYTHGSVIDRIGYHTRDYFLHRMDLFSDIPRGVIAHCTHVKGIGTFTNGLENPRVNVVLATSISPERCARVNLGYMNPDEINITDYQNKEDQGILVVPHAGELLHRLGDSAPYPPKSTPRD